MVMACEKYQATQEGESYLHGATSESKAIPPWTHRDSEVSMNKPLDPHWISVAVKQLRMVKEHMQADRIFETSNEG